MPSLTLSYSVADQQFNKAKSLGILNVSLGLLEGLAARPEFERVTVLANTELKSRLRLPDRATIERHDQATRGSWGRLRWDQWGVYSAAERAGNTWLFLPKGFASFVRRPPLRLAAYVHDVMPEYYREHHPGVVPRLEELYFCRSLQATLRHAHLIVTNSEFTAAEVTRLADRAGLRRPRVRAVGIGFDRPSIAPGGDRRGLVVLTSRWPHKQTARAVEYLARWQDESSFSEPIHWVGSMPEPLAWPRLPNWRKHPRLPDADYAGLLGMTRALLYFTECEGFGMPPVEALAAGAAPVYPDIPATREAMGGRGFPFRLPDYASFGRSLQDALSVAPSVLAHWAAEVLALHAWPKVVQRTVAAIAEADAEPVPSPQA